MNTDKLMELERKWRAEADELDAMADRCSATTEHESRQDFQSRAERERNRADELAAALSAREGGEDARDKARMDWLEAHPGWLDTRFLGQKRQSWKCADPFTNYEFKLFPSARAAIDAAMPGDGEVGK